MSEVDDTDTAAEQANRRGKRRALWLRLLVFLFAGAGVGYAAYWYFAGRYYISTADAYVEGNQVRLMPEISGIVTEIHAEETDRVREGQALVEIEHNDVDLAFEQAKAQLAETVRVVRQLYRQVSAQRAAIETLRVRFAQARKDFLRYQHLMNSHSVSKETFQHGRSTMQALRFQLAQAQEKLAELQAMTDGTDLRHHPRVLLAETALRKAYLDRQRTTLQAPVSGYVAQRGVQVGQRVRPGEALMAIVPVEQVWVYANFKETDLSGMRIGQAADVTSDFYGSDVHYRGRVVGIKTGTGSVFEVLPPQNATGNWIKVVRRVPVRIRLDTRDLAEHPLRLGLSMEVTVDIHDQRGETLAQPSAPEPLYRSGVYRYPQAPIDGLIERIVNDNGGADAAGGPSAPSDN